MYLVSEPIARQLVEERVEKAAERRAHLADGLGQESADTEATAATRLERSPAVVLSTEATG